MCIDSQEVDIRVQSCRVIMLLTVLQLMQMLKRRHISQDRLYF